MKNKITYIITSIFFLTALGLNGQCFPDRHNTSWFNGWASCEESDSPNVDRGKSHWIMYDLKGNYNLGQLQLWNVNDPNHLDWGFDEYVIDLSKDGENWIEAGVYHMGMAPGINNYEGQEGPNLEGFEGQFVLITAISNYGGECYGFSEIRIEAIAESLVSSVNDPGHNDCFSLTASPNPFTEHVRIEIKADCVGEVHYSIVDVLGKIIEHGKHVIDKGENILPIRLSGIPAGSYFVRIDQGAYHAQMSLVKM